MTKGKCGQKSRIPELVEGLSFSRVTKKKGRASTSSANRLLLTACALLATPAVAQTIAFTGGTVATGDGSAPAPGTVVIRDGCVVAAGPSATVPAGAQIVDATGKWVVAGMVAGFSRLGLVEVDAVDASNDAVARNTPFNASLDVTDAINPRVPSIAINRARGVTRAIVAPEAAGNMFAGQGAIIDTASDANPVTKARAFQFVEFGETGARISGGSRPASFAGFRTALAEARDFGRAPGSYDGRTRDALLLRADAQALLRVIDGTVPLAVHVEGGPDIVRVLGLVREFSKLRLVLVGATEGWTVAREIAAARVPVIASALIDLPTQFESVAATQSNIGRMRAAGVDVSIGTINDDDTRMAIRTPQYAGNLVALTKVPGATGLDWASAFAAVTSGPARAMGMGAEIGSLTPGRRADVVLWSGDPLELTSGVERVWIDGVEQSTQTRQTRLRDRYLTPTEGALPKAYDR